MKFFGAFVVLACFVPAASAQTSSSNVVAYQNRCSSCHGATMTGGSAPAILTYIRYHTDSEVTAAIRERHRNIQASVPDSDLPAIMAGMRELSGTNPAMATGGFTGRRGGGAGDAGGGGAAIGGRGAAAPAPSPGRRGLISGSSGDDTRRRQHTTDHDQDGRWPVTDGRAAQRSPKCLRCFSRTRTSNCSRKMEACIVKKPSRQRRIGLTTTAASPATATVRSS